MYFYYYFRMWEGLSHDISPRLWHQQEDLSKWMCSEGLFFILFLHCKTQKLLFLWSQLLKIITFNKQFQFQYFLVGCLRKPCRWNQGGPQRRVQQKIMNKKWRNHIVYIAINNKYTFFGGNICFTKLIVSYDIAPTMYFFYQICLTWIFNVNKLLFENKTQNHFFIANTMNRKIGKFWCFIHSRFCVRWEK
jgi:hypothetical protein